MSKLSYIKDFIQNEYNKNDVCLVELLDNINISELPRLDISIGDLFDLCISLRENIDQDEFYIKSEGDMYRL